MIQRALLCLAIVCGAVVVSISTVGATGERAIPGDDAQRLHQVYQSQPTPPPPPYLPYVIETVELINRERSVRGLAPLQLDRRLADAAQWHSMAQAEVGAIFHTGPGSSTAASRIADESYSTAVWGENVAGGFLTPAQVVRGWMRSPSHCRNILHPGVTDIGIGVVDQGPQTGRWSIYWTMLVARPDHRSGTSASAPASWCW